MGSAKEEEIHLVDHLKSVAGPDGLISYKTFIKEVLFAPKMGYYMKERSRVGRNSETDFYTAESLGLVFKKLVIAAIKKLLGDEDCGQFTFVEIGAEPGKGFFEKDDIGHHPFQDTKIIRSGQKIEIPPKSIVFANELLDAQPFHRLFYKNGRWKELGVRIVDKNGILSEEFLPELSNEVKERLDDLPNEVDEGYQLDLPLESEKLLESIVTQDWQGLIILFDYGLSWEDLIYNHPQGTARAYYKHKQHNDLLANVGNQDITCHICWDPLIKILKNYHFIKPILQRQESFFVHNANLVIEEIINIKMDKPVTGMRMGFNSDKQTLQELIHPGHMGHKFQVLWGRR